VTESLGVGLKQTWLLLEKIGGTVYAAIFPSQHAEGSAAPAKFEVHSILGFMQMASAYLKQGLNAFLAVAAALNVNLGFLNLLPIPVLDGGHLVFLSIEKARGKAVSVSLQFRLISIFIWVLIGLALLGLYNDLAHPFH
jgi:regulator of sigma E protease